MLTLVSPMVPFKPSLCYWFFAIPDESRKNHPPAVSLPFLSLLDAIDSVEMVLRLTTTIITQCSALVLKRKAKYLCSIISWIESNIHELYLLLNVTLLDYHQQWTCMHPVLFYMFVGITHHGHHGRLNCCATELLSAFELHPCSNKS